MILKRIIIIAIALLQLITSTLFANSIKHSHSRGTKQLNSRGFTLDQQRNIEYRLRSATTKMRFIVLKYFNLPEYRRAQIVQNFFGNDRLAFKKEVIKRRLQLTMEQLLKTSNKNLFSTKWARRFHPNRNFIFNGLPPSDDEFYAAVNWYGLMPDGAPYVYDPNIYFTDAYFSNSKEQNVILWHEVSHLIGATEDQINAQPELFDVFLAIPTRDYDLQVGDRDSIEDAYVWEKFLNYMDRGAGPRTYDF